MTEDELRFWAPGRTLPCAKKLYLRQYLVDKTLSRLCLGGPSSFGRLLNNSRAVPRLELYSDQ